LSDSPARIQDDVTVEVTRGPMTRLEAIRHILDNGKEAAYLNQRLVNRSEESLKRLGIGADELIEAEELP
jgi:hypothetical protein